MKFTLAVVALVVAISLINGAIAPAQDGDRGKSLYEDKCAECHGATGKGDGPAAATLPRPMPDFAQEKFWRDNPNKKIQTAVEEGHGAMPPLDLKPDEIKAITDYMTRAYRK